MLFWSLRNAVKLSFGIFLCPGGSQKASVWLLWLPFDADRELWHISSAHHCTYVLFRQYAHNHGTAQRLYSVKH